MERKELLMGEKKQEKKKLLRRGPERSQENMRIKIFQYRCHNFLNFGKERRNKKRKAKSNCKGVNKLIRTTITLNDGTILD